MQDADDHETAHQSPEHPPPRLRLTSIATIPHATATKMLEMGAAPYGL